MLEKSPGPAALPSGWPTARRVPNSLPGVNMSTLTRGRAIRGAGLAVLVAGALVATAAGVLAQTETSTGAARLADVDLEDLLNTTVVSAARHPQRIIESPRSISVITAEDLRERNYRTIPEALAELAGVFLQETNYGGGAPIIRGLIGNRILILVDGVRLNNSTYRLGPNQYLNTIDIHQVERIEVLRGTRSVLYGSDAIGGLINVITRSPEPSTTGAVLRGSLESRLATADKSATGHVSAEYYRQRLGILAGLSDKNFGNLRAGDPVGRQSYTAYKEADGDLKLTYTISAQQAITAAFQRVRQMDIWRTDVLRPGMKGEPPPELRNEWEPQQRDLASIEYRHRALGSVVSGLQLTASYQDQLEEQERILASDSGVRRDEYNDVQTCGAGLQMSTDLGEHHALTYGADYYRDRVASRRTDVELATGKRTPNIGRVADGARYWSEAIFLQDEFRPVESLALNCGIRYSQFSLRATSQHKKTGPVKLSSNPHAFTGSANASYRLRTDLYLMGGVGQGFRAPNVDDMTVLGSFANGFEVPSSHLDPEEAINYELGLKRQGHRLSGAVFGFLGKYRNLIDRAPGLFEGLPFLDANHDGIQQTNEEMVYERKNIGGARIHGIEMEGSGRLGRAVSLFGTFAWTRGEDTVAHLPLTRVPPPSGTGGLRWTLGDDQWLEAYTTFAGKQSRLSAADRSDRRIGLNGTPGWTTLNLRGGLAVGSALSITVGIENILDTSYRRHGSGLDAPGRNLVAGVRASV
jgi:hemoglobin/transferrin/lactoferrin receptor protein